MYLCGKLWIEKMASKRYGSGVFVRLTGEQEMFVREYGEKPDEEEL